MVVHIFMLEGIFYFNKSVHEKKLNVFQKSSLKIKIIETKETVYPFLESETKKQVDSISKGKKQLLKNKQFRENIIQDKVKKFSYNDFLPNSSDKFKLLQEIELELPQKLEKTKAAIELQRQSNLIHILKDLDFNYSYLSEILIENFSSAIVTATLIYKENFWHISRIHSKNAYFRAYFYKILQNVIEDKVIKKKLSDQNILKINFMIIYQKKYSLDEEIGLKKQIKIENDHIIYQFSMFEKPKGYDLIEGGVNLFAAAKHFAEAVSPTEIDQFAEIKQLKKLRAFHENINNFFE